ncbi:adenylate cyclase [Actinomyces sp. HMSC075C01]|uniref:Adenylate/guanylate cyclase domain-containing protein n=1 Tax=Actinomyces oris TaxID=544580 RepID=A0A1Q8VWD8_9ACTO|nr:MULTISPECIES: adenylate/guanylate cyclase domain-containing protein [Actinomyces]OFR55910.1 adenylate cyclase [Actinomyces sp. HMSC075C01]OLO52572.1 adenylate/guanylate cyclase domain-containing protein [Actinomyces oris]OLO61854.1 adenylate/guanylate cyclase domain-containing protein [Actinomyces oris]
MTLDNRASEGRVPDSHGVGGGAVQRAHEGTPRVEGKAVAEADHAERTTLAGHEYLLLGEVPSLTLTEVAQRAGTSVEVAQKFWRAMGFADVQPDEVHFTEQDVAALEDTMALLDETSDSSLASASVLELLRAQSYTMDRLVLWELETFVTDLSERLGLDDTSARLVALDRIDGLVELLSRQLTYVWRRHMVSILGRTDAEVSTRGREDTGPDLYPLIRSLGFVDIVSFTQRAQGMSKAALTHMLEGFENTARDVITSRGARVVKTIGDAVMYISDDLLIAADVVTALVDELQKGPDAIRVRASLVEGRVISRSGDVFGPTVNLASRLVDAAEPGSIRLDESTAMAILRSPEAGRYRVGQCHEVVAKGLGQIVPWSLERTSPTRP